MTSLKEEALNNPDLAYIRLDSREPKALLELLRSKYKLTVSYEQLLVGDVLFSDICIERKTVADMLASLRDGRIWEQLAAAKENYPRPIIILEGQLPFSYNKSSAIDEMKLIGGLLGVAMGWGIPIIPTNNMEQTAKVISSAFMRSNKAKVEYLKPTKPKHYTTPEVREDILCSIPGVGRRAAKKILKAFPTISAINNATDEELRALKRIGAKTVKWIRVALADDEFAEVD